MVRCQYNRKDLRAAEEMANEFRIDNKHSVDKLIGLIREGNWKAQNFLYEKSKAYCRTVYKNRFFGIPDDELESIICFSTGKTISTYKICGKYWGLLAVIFTNDIHDYLKKPLIPPFLDKGIKEVDITQVPDESDASEKETIGVFNKALSMKPQEHQICLQLMLEGYNDDKIERLMAIEKSIKDLKYHAKMNLKTVLIEKFGWKAKK